MKRYLLLSLFAAPAIAQDFAPLIDADYVTVDPAIVEIGRDLFWDPILSGNQNISCATCHHPRFGTADGLSLGVGEGGVGLGPDRHITGENTPEQRIPRNAPALFNLGAREFTVLFHDGRLEQDDTRPSGIRSPIEDDMVSGFSGVLSAQTMFPVLSADEMAGHYSENEISRAVRQGIITGQGGAWSLLTARVAALPAYADRFDAALPELAERPLDFTDISNAIAAFMAWEWRADDSPFDQFLRGEVELSAQADAGRQLFYGQAGCADCHAGPLQTDHAFHAIGMPQFGPGKAARFENHNRDEGRSRVTGDLADMFAFRTPSLRNVTATAPYGHNGAFATLEGVVRHHLGAQGWDQTQVVLPDGFDDHFDTDADAAIITDASALTPIALGDAEVAQILAFLGALTDRGSIDGRLGIPDSVPSGLPIDR
ncbi:cytochrome c peroxidase [Monaibacterium marinum]|uniref:Cytochrome c peroxidase n=1 Tax=Pontivivens marinum TaxID=1690039 RepID=A0A2C9CUS8_9RHOB|nr:cytochrome c peroxidase [Monaibacterium marinum]SOH95074.1 cytochrome c peroxidase [Monaibacterium marinum]